MDLSALQAAAGRLDRSTLLAAAGAATCLLFCRKAGFSRPSDLFAHVDGKNWKKRENNNAIICPVMKTMYANDDLKTDDKGYTDAEKCKEAGWKLGCRSPPLLQIISRAAWDGPFDIFKMPHVKHHTFATGILSSGVPDAARFDALMGKFAKDGRVYKKDTWVIAKHVEGDSKTWWPKKHAPVFGDFVAAWDIMHEVWGRCDENGQVYMTVDDFRGMYFESRYPAGWEKRSHPWGIVQFLPVLVKLVQFCGLKSVRDLVYDFIF